ncbi:hypothetical protein F0562_016367 [Nyssa sinensis]|uniref:F-box domain-containing protein n=1 Tax=Nyssa sinensis TaxID=561372 RepID=A0A5J4ZLP7_9ASTE|nr:hypothetical protein F0562_016367 [Nyssa sinensis]
MEGGPDFISNLPCEIQQQIVSLIPLKEAVKTSILSTAWRRLWSPFQVDLDFDSDHVTGKGAIRKLMQAMDTFLKSCHSPEVWKFCLSNSEKEKDQCPLIKNGLVFFATKGVEEELYLDFSGGKQMTSNFSLILKQSCPCPCKYPVDTSSLSSLKTLHLRSVNHLSNNLVSTFFCNCWLLENLKLEKCTGLQTIDIDANNNLQSFKIIDCPNMVRITLSAPSLKTFWYQGVLAQIQLITSPHLDVILNLREGLGHNEFDCEDVLSLLSSLKDIEILTISGWLLEWLCTAGVIFGRLAFQFSNLKELCWIGSLMDKPKRDSLASFLNILPSMERLFVNIDQSYCSIPCPIFHQYWHEPHLWMDYETVKSNVPQLEHLRIVKLIGFSSQEDELLLLDLLLKKAVILKSMIVTSAENQSWSVFLFRSSKEIMEAGPDFISSLPCEIQQQIVSLIPLKEAVKTSILSSAWRRLWSPFQVELDFDSNHVTSDGASGKLMQAMADFLKSCHSPEVWKFCLSTSEKEKDQCSRMKNGLVFFATKGVEKELYLDFSGGKQMTCNFSLILKQSCPIPCKHPIDTYSFSSLKTLHLRSVNQLSNNLVSSFFSNCWLLENLKLENCTGLQSIDIDANNNLQSFKIIDCPNMVRITLSALNLKSFWYQGALAQIQLKSSPHLDVILNLREGLGHNEFDCEDVLSLLASLKDIEILAISGWILEWLCTAGVIFGRLAFQFSNLKELCWIGSLIDKPKRDSLASFLNILPSLEKLFVNIDQSYSSIPCPFFHQYWHEPHLWMDYATVKSNAPQLEHLRIVKMIGFSSQEDELLLLDLLLEKAVCLKSMIVTSAENQSWRVCKIPRSQLKQTSRSYSKQIEILSPNKECFFGLTEEDSNGLYLSNYHFL